ncbi:PspC domain-containing protein [Candidatus Woesearchaeota archaeon]|nr:PspC domain-containing protein [Candidatus Woesearchaeota archaeon]
MVKPIKRLYRSRNNQIIGGVCAGIADYFEVDPVLVRLIWVIATLFSMGLGILAYIIAWIIIPEEPKAPKQKH